MYIYVYVLICIYIYICMYKYQNESRFYINLKHPIMRMKTDLIVHFDSLSKGLPINNSSR